MVYFSCDACAEVLKKNQVDNHARRCRGCDSVSCVDCLVSFYGDDYRAHTSCMTEVERYEKRGDNSSSNGQKKGGKKSPQEAWMDLVASAVDEAPAHLKSQLSIIAGLDNVPRKEKQFRNFASNSLNLRGNNNNSRGANVVSEIWHFLKSRQQQAQDERKKVEEQQALENQSKTNKTEKGKSELSCKQLNESNAAAVQVIISENESTESSGVAVDVEATESSDKPEIITAKTVRKAMKTVLKKNNSLSTKRLRKAVQQHMGASKCNKKAIKSMISQNLKNGNDDKKSQTFILEGKTVSLRTN